MHFSLCFTLLVSFVLATATQKPDSYSLGRWKHWGSHDWHRGHKGHKGGRPAAFNDTVFALEYGDALVGFAKIATPLSAIGANKLFINGNLATPNLRVVVSPNVDTIYAATVLDLSQSDLTISVPQIPDDRYWSFAFYDPFGTNYVNLGTVNNSTAGNYTFELAPLGKKSGFQNSAAYGLSGKTIITPVAYSILLIRLLVRNNTTDVDAARTLLQQCQLTPLPRASAGTQNIRPLNSSLFTGLNVTTDHPTDILNLTARIAPYNPPFDAYSPSQHVFPATVTKRLHCAGLSNGAYHPPPKVNISAAQNSALRAIAQAGAAHATDLGNGWVRSSVVGRYGADFATRSYIALGFYLALVDTETLYPIFNKGQALEIGAGEAYVFTFSSRPPVRETVGFWSLTVYGEDHFLVENPIGVYALGDRSNLTYADGTRVYGAEEGDRDGSFQILVQPADVAPPANWTNNWIPSPAGGGLTYCVLRLYVPTPALSDGTWEYPVVSKVAALT